MFMFNKSAITTLVTALVVVASISTVHADSVGYLDMERLFANYKEGKKIQGDLQLKREEYQKMVEDKQKQVEAAKSSKKSDKDVQELISKIELELRPKQEEILQNEAEVQSRLVVRIKELSRTIAKRYGIDVVLDRRAVMTGGFDLTDFVVEKLNSGETVVPIVVPSASSIPVVTPAASTTANANTPAKKVKKVKKGVKVTKPVIKPTLKKKA